MGGNNEFFENFENKQIFEKITQHAKSYAKSVTMAACLTSIVPLA